MYFYYYLEVSLMKNWTRFHNMWAMSLFGTAVGAGVLFLPITAGLGGIWPLIIMTIIVGPMTYLAHRALARFVLASSKPGSDITVVVEEFFGKKAGFLVTVLYFFAIYPILLIYGVGITNSVDSFFVYQLGISDIPRWVLAIGLNTFMVSILLLGERPAIKATELLVYPLCIMLLILSLALIPHWNFDIFTHSAENTNIWVTFFLTIPILVFSFNHSPAISSFALSVQEQYPDDSVKQSDKILFCTSGMLLIFVMFFVYSCLFCLSHDDLLAAKDENISIVSYLANKLNVPFISWFAPPISILAIGSSFFGHYLGAREGLRGIAIKLYCNANKQPPMKSINMLIPVFFLSTLCFVAMENPSIIDLISSLGGPIIAAILFIMPMYAIYKVPAMKVYAKPLLPNVFVTFMGLVAIGGLVYALLISI